jgi:tRNA A-37 threonylcarbamoyl transferase component Bud32
MGSAKSDEEPGSLSSGRAPGDDLTQHDVSVGSPPVRSPDSFDASLDQPTPLAEPIIDARRAGEIPALQSLLDRQMEAWLGGDRLWVETILEEYPALRGSDMVVALLQNEIALREAVGETPAKEEYRARFPLLEHRVRSRFFSTGDQTIQDGVDEVRPEPTDDHTFAGVQSEAGTDDDTFAGVEPDEGTDDKTFAGVEPDEGTDGDDTFAGVEPEPTDSDTFAGVEPDEGTDDKTFAGVEPDAGTPWPEAPTVKKGTPGTSATDQISDSKSLPLNGTGSTLPTGIIEADRSVGSATDQLADSKSVPLSGSGSTIPEGVVEAGRSAGSATDQMSGSMPEPGHGSGSTIPEGKPPPRVAGKPFPRIAGKPSLRVPPVSSPLKSPVPGYEVLGELGRGGMGVVYKARHIKLNRIVALKMVSAGGDLARFAVEAQAIAKLQHPNIVQIYEIGERNGAPFFSLEYLEGGTLQKKLEDPQTPMQAAALMETLARAVHFAHEHGIVHRDLKPANVLFARDGTPKIADFGLAKKLDDDELGQTATDAVLGTPTFMSPEQAEGKTSKVGPSADVYALGAILYDMLTGRPPFRGSSILDTLVLVRTAEPVPPRRLQPKVPIDLQTICLKCLEKDPFRRYQSAAALADDLRSLLEGRSIHARPTPALERAWKWAKRRPTAAALVVVSTLAVLGLIGGLTYHSQEQRALRLVADEQRDVAKTEKLRAEREKDRAEGNERKAKEQKELAEGNERKAKEQKELAEGKQREAVAAKKLAEDNFGVARRAVNDLMRAARRPPLNMPGMEDVRKKLLKGVVVYYEELAGRYEKDPALARDTAQSYRHLGDIYELVNRPRDAADAYRKAAARFEALLGQAAKSDDVNANNKPLWNELADVRGKLWVVLEDDPKEQAAAETSLRLARETLERLAKAFPKEERYRFALACTHNNEGIRLLRQAVKPDPVSVAPVLGLTAAPAVGGPLSAAASLVAGKARRLDEARAHYRLARETFGGLSHAFQEGAECQLEIARTEKNLAVALTAEPAAAEELYVRATDRLLHALRRQGPDTAQRSEDDAKLFSATCRRELGQLYLDLGLLKSLRGRDQALAYFDKAVETLGDLAKSSQEVPEYSYLLASAYRNRGDLLREAGQRGAVADLTTARRLLEELRPHFRDNPLYRLELAQTCLSLGKANVAPDGRPTAEATAAPWQAVMDLLEEEVAAPDAADARRLYLDAALGLLHYHTALAHQAEESRRWPEADAKLNDILVVRRRVLGVLPSDEYRNKLASTLLTQAGLRLRVDYVYDHKAAAAALAELPADTPATWGHYRQAAAYLGRCMSLANTDATMSVADRRQRVRTYGDEAMALLRRAAEHEWREMNNLRTAEEFAPLRDRPEFLALVRDVERKRAVEPMRPGP